MRKKNLIEALMYALAIEESTGQARENELRRGYRGILYTTLAMETGKKYSQLLREAFDVQPINKDAR